MSIAGIEVLMLSSAQLCYPHQATVRGKSQVLTEAFSSVKRMNPGQYLSGCDATGDAQCGSLTAPPFPSN